MACCRDDARDKLLELGYLGAAPMEIDVECLLEARTENLERLAVALGVRLPRNPGSNSGYTRRLVRAVLKGLAADRRAHRPRKRWGRPGADASAR